MTKDEALAYGDTDEGLTSIEDTCDALDALAARVRELEAQHGQDIDAAVYAGFLMGWTADAGSECVNQAHAAVAHYRASRKGGSA